jgi:hypothetical protein
MRDLERLPGAFLVGGGDQVPFVEGFEPLELPLGPHPRGLGRGDRAPGLLDLLGPRPSLQVALARLGLRDTALLLRGGRQDRDEDRGGAALGHEMALSHAPHILARYRPDTGEVRLAEMPAAH